MRKNMSNLKKVIIAKIYIITVVCVLFGINAYAENSSSKKESKEVSHAKTVIQVIDPTGNIIATAERNPLSVNPHLQAYQTEKLISPDVKSSTSIENGDYKQSRNTASDNYSKEAYPMNSSDNYTNLEDKSDYIEKLREKELQLNALSRELRRIKNASSMGRNNNKVASWDHKNKKKPAQTAHKSNNTVPVSSQGILMVQSNMGIKRVPMNLKTLYALKYNPRSGDVSLQERMAPSNNETMVIMPTKKLLTIYAAGSKHDLISGWTATIDATNEDRRSFSVVVGLE
jgi:hypothetical protein